MVSFFGAFGSVHEAEAEAVEEGLDQERMGFEVAVNRQGPGQGARQVGGCTGAGGSRIAEDR